MLSWAPCRPRESSGEGFLGDFLSLLGYSHGSGGALLDGTLKLKYHTLPFTRRKPTWRLPVEGNVSLVIAEFERSLVHPDDPSVGGVRGRDFLNRRFKRVRLTCLQDPVGDFSPGHGRVVVRRVHGASSPGSRLDNEGIG